MKSFFSSVTGCREGLRDRCLEIFPHAQHQSCWVHIQRNVLRLVRNKDKQEVADALKAVYQCKTSKEANKALDDFIETYKDKYPKIQDRFESRDSLFSWLSFPKDIQCSLYTSNLIKGLNKQLKRKIKQKEQFSNEASLERFVCTRFMEYNQQFSNRIHRGFNKVQKELVDMFDQRYK